MIYENEELRLKTININAEVERGKCPYIPKQPQKYLSSKHFQRSINIKRIRVRITRNRSIFQHPNFIDDFLFQKKKKKYE